MHVHFRFNGGFFFFFLSSHSILLSTFILICPIFILFFGPDALPDSDARDDHHPFPLNAPPSPPTPGGRFAAPGQSRGGVGSLARRAPDTDTDTALALARRDPIVRSFFSSPFLAYILVLRGDLMRRFVVLSCLVLWSSLKVTRSPLVTGNH